MQYIIKGTKNFVCISDEGVIFTSPVTIKAYKSSYLSDIIRLYDALLNNPYLYYSDRDWSIVEWEKELDTYTRYLSQRDLNKKPTTRQSKCKNKHKRISFSKSTRRLVYEKSNHKCAICGKELQIDYCNDDDYATIDHIIPLNKGGKNELDNYQATCQVCNKIKSDIMPDVFAFSMKSTLVKEIMDEENLQNQLLKILLNKKINRIVLKVKTAIL